MTLVWNSVLPLYLNLEPILKNVCLILVGLPGLRRRKKAWCSTALFHRCLQPLSELNLEQEKRHRNTLQ